FTDALVNPNDTPLRLAMICPLTKDTLIVSLFAVPMMRSVPWELTDAKVVVRSSRGSNAWISARRDTPAPEKDTVAILIEIGELCTRAHPSQRTSNIVLCDDRHDTSKRAGTK